MQIQQTNSKLTLGTEWPYHPLLALLPDTLFTFWTNVSSRSLGGVELVGMR